MLHLFLPRRQDEEVGLQTRPAFRSGFGIDSGVSACVHIEFTLSVYSTWVCITYCSLADMTVQMIVLPSVLEA